MISFNPNSTRIFHKSHIPSLCKHLCYPWSWEDKDSKSKIGGDLGPAVTLEQKPTVLMCPLYSNVIAGPNWGDVYCLN